MKRCYRIGIIGLLVALLAVAIMPALPVWAIALPDSTPSVITKKCYRNILEAADFLIVWEANIPYASLPDDPVTDTFIWEFIDTDGTTVLGSTTGWAYQGSGYNYQAFSMYFDAAAGLTWDPTPSYSLRLQGNPLAFDTPPTYNYTITSSEYSSFTVTADVQDEITIDVLLIAADLDLEWGLATSLVLDDETGQTLSTFGQAYFRGAIYGLQALAPGLFPLALTTIDIADRTWTDSYVSSLENQWSGSWVDTAKQGGAALFGTSFDLLSIILLLIGIIALFIGNTMLTNDHWNAAIDVAFFLIVTAKLSFYGLGYLGLLVALCVIYLGMRLFKFPH
jgi:hypothetical protein